MQLPSNKIGGLFIIVVLLVALVIGGDVFYDKIRPTGAPELVDADIVLARKTTDNSSVDRDNDGLLDWQESLYGSDPVSADTDGDGTNDGDEIKDGRDPTVPGPDDTLINTKTIIKDEFNTEGYTPGSMTDNLSKDLFASYLTLKGENQLNSESGEFLATELANSVGYQANLITQYSREDLNLVDSSDENLTKYGNDFAVIYIDYLNQFESAKDLPDNEYLKVISEKHKALSGVLASMNVPDVAVNVHHEIINRVYNTGLILEDMIDYETDPLKSLLAVKKAQINSNGEVELYSSLANYFEDNDIIFTDNNVIRFWNSYK